MSTKVSRGFCFRLAVAAGLGVICLPHSVWADTVTAVQTLTIPSTATNWNAGTAGIGDPLVFAQFDPTLGTLQSVNYSLGGIFEFSFSEMFVTSSSISSTAANNVLTLKLPDATKIATATIADQTESATAFGGVFPKTVTSQGAVNVPIVSGELITPGDLALFTGTGTIGLPITAASQSLFTTTSGNGSGTADAAASAFASISYTYTPNAVSVPLPAAVLGGVVLCGLLGLSQIRLRRVQIEGI